MDYSGVYDSGVKTCCSNLYMCLAGTALVSLTMGIGGLVQTANCAPTDDGCHTGRSMAIVTTTIGAIAATALTAMALYEGCKARRERSVSTVTQTTPLVTQVVEETLHTNIVL
jgi:hypothetical protein